MIFQYRHCERSEAIQKKWIAASACGLLAMTSPVAIRAQAGIHRVYANNIWTPAFAGVTLGMKFAVEAQKLAGISLKRPIG
ncbi:MAG: hypothetical protein DYH13_01740 [Alphaproteobacteria bacterium PRO2]|nr:hypothetical protein [Alphaproteobacteria bacterium PRO2]